MSAFSSFTVEDIWYYVSDQSPTLQTSLHRVQVAQQCLSALPRAVLRRLLTCLRPHWLHMLILTAHSDRWVCTWSPFLTKNSSAGRVLCVCSHRQVCVSVAWCVWRHTSRLREMGSSFNKLAWSLSTEMAALQISTCSAWVIGTKDFLK